MAAKRKELPEPTTREEWEFHRAVGARASEIYRAWCIATDKLAAADRYPRKDQFWREVAAICLRDGIQTQALMQALLAIAPGTPFSNMLKNETVLEMARCLPAGLLDDARDTWRRDMTVYRQYRELQIDPLTEETLGLNPVFKYAMASCLGLPSAQESRLAARLFVREHPEYKQVVVGTVFEEVVNAL